MSQSPTSSRTPLDEALRRLGGLTQAAHTMGIGVSAITNWRHRGRVPLDRALWLERKTQVPARELAPWFFNEERPEGARPEP